MRQSNCLVVRFQLNRKNVTPKQHNSSIHNLQTFSSVFRDGKRRWFRRRGFRNFRERTSILCVVLVELQRERQYGESLPEIFQRVAPHVCCYTVFGALCVDERTSTKIDSNTYILVE